MGRCYEFGVPVGDGCEHPMVVAADGSACVCSGCGTVCKGRFKGCAAILARPGYVPVAVAAGPAASAAAADVAAAAPPVVAVAVVPDPLPTEPDEPDVPALAEVRSLLEAMLDRPERTSDAVEALRHELRTRDAALGEAFERLILSYDRLMEEVVADRHARERLVDAVGQLSDRLTQVEQRAARTF